MSDIIITLPAYVMPVESRGVVFNADLAKIPHGIFLMLIPHAIKQKLADAVSGTPKLCYMASKPEGSPSPSRDQLTEWCEANKATVETAIYAGMAKAFDAMEENRWQVRVTNDGTSSKWSEEQSLALDIAKGSLIKRFTDALAKASPNLKPTATNFVTLSPKVAAYFKANDKRPTWDDKAVMAWITTQAAAEKPRDIMAEAREELARRETASALMSDDLDDMLGDI
jgi:hypothetical protein